MSTTTKTVKTTTSGVAVHTISFRGLAGAIFVCLVSSALLYVVGFATNSWAIIESESENVSPTHQGLWAHCTCPPESTKTMQEEWFWATQAMIALGLLGLIVCLILSGLYLTVHTISKNSTILALVIFCFLTVIFMVVGFAIFGSYMGGDVNWSFAICVIASLFCLIAAILAIVQMKKSGVRV